MAGPLGVRVRIEHLVDVEDHASLAFEKQQPLHVDAIACIDGTHQHLAVFHQVGEYPLAVFAVEREAEVGHELSLLITEHRDLCLLGSTLAVLLAGPTSWS